jgi:exodeoxyribonuclease (lambda-induced)
MPPKYINVQQGTPEWLHARCGFITASRIADVTSYNQPSSELAKSLGFKLVRDAVAAGIKGEPSAARAKYMKELRAERICGRAAERFFTPAMRHGSEYEDEARNMYGAWASLQSGQMIIPEQVGFAIHGLIEFSGASPDALIGDDGMIELKAPTQEVHLDYYEAGVVPEEYIPQCYWGMEVCERKWCDFISYHPAAINAEGDFRLFIKRIEYDPAIAKYYCDEVIKFEGELRESMHRLAHPTTFKDAIVKSLEAR